MGGSDLDAKESVNGFTAFLTACFKGHAECVGVLAELGAVGCAPPLCGHAKEKQAEEDPAAEDPKEEKQEKQKE